MVGCEEFDVNTPLEAVAGGRDVIDGAAEFKSSGRRVAAEPGVAVEMTGLSISDSVSATSPRALIFGSLVGPGVVRSGKD